MNTKIILNGKMELLSEDSQGQLTLDFFNLLLDNAKELILNDDGGEKFKVKLKKFDINEDKTLGHKWHFVVNDKSKSLLLEVLNWYIQKQGGHFKWSLIGDDFKIDFEDVSDEITYPEYEKERVCNLFKIEAKEKSLTLIKKCLKTNK